MKRRGTEPQRHRVAKVAAFGLFFLLLTFSGCGQKKQREPVTLRFNLGAEPETIDPARSTGLVEAKVELQCFEGLTRLGKNNEPVPGIAESWEISPDGLHYTFHLRESKWSNGDKLTAHDFEYAWKRALSPKLGAEYAYQLFYLKNGEKFNKGKVPESVVGIKAADDRTLMVELEAPTPYFLSLTSFPTLLPVNKEVVESQPDTWAAKPETYIGNGPFRLVKWQHRYEMQFERNPDYWDAGKVKLDALLYTMIEEATTALSSFESGQLDYMENPPFHEIARLKKENKLSVSPLIATYFVRFNVMKPKPTQSKIAPKMFLYNESEEINPKNKVEQKSVPWLDKYWRGEFCTALNRQQLVEEVLKGGQKPAFAFVPYGIPDVNGKDFRENGGDSLLLQGKSAIVTHVELKGIALQGISYLYDTNELHKIIAEAFQGMWKKNLGVNVELRNVEWKVYLQTVRDLKYTLARARWYGDYIDPMTFLDMFVTGGGNNQTGWSNKKYDALISAAKNENDKMKRSQELHGAEKILMDEMPVCPVFFLTDLYLVKPYVKNAQRSILGMVDFKESEIVR